MKSKITLLLVLPFLLNFCAPQEGPLPAADVLAMAKKQAKKEGKNVFIMWHASWCGWCHRMDSLMNAPDVKEYFDSNYVIEHLVVKESKDKKDLENPGAEELLSSYLGDKSGIPFWVILDKKGNLLADSFMRADSVGMDQPGTNTGCPAQQEEVDYFIKVLNETAAIPEEGLEKIAARFIRK